MTVLFALSALLPVVLSETVDTAPPEAEHAPTWLERYEIEWLCDWPDYLHRYVGGPEGLEANWQFVDRRGLFELWRRRQ